MRTLRRYLITLAVKFFDRHILNREGLLDALAKMGELQAAQAEVSVILAAKVEQLEAQLAEEKDRNDRLNRIIGDALGVVRSKK